MAKSISVRQKKRGRPATGKMPTTTLRLPEKLSEQIDAWAHKQADGPGHSEAIRRLVELGLKAKVK
jgi:Arc/MetJ-type ribon-helix-helix transcriptional regulator